MKLYSVFPGPSCIHLKNYDQFNPPAICGEINACGIGRR